ncbi:CvpA family protein [Macrococcus hajekii]|uniref:CvpA family protein n=1 Tax=Macrococcus hajekii TaxID=198482 RepID=A0A4R6BLU1_9STAP|nr:CvpA family protein [Macrococcus hajekii]TDM02769.1 CvpA family protein [Macrococcus hajekii]GGB03764.1 membrane protein [Macrococcus hajekii]
MIDIILLFFLLLGSIIGLRRGFILQSMHLIGTIGALVIARLFYQPLADKLQLIVPYPSVAETSKVLINWQDAEHAFYNIISFIFLFMASKVLLQMVATVFDYIAQLPLLKQLNKSLGTLLGFIESYLVLFIVFFFIAMIPAPVIQGRIQSSHLARMIIEYTPILSNRAIDWFQHIAFIHIF